MTTASRSPLTVSPLWLQASILTFVIGFGIMGFLAMRVYQDHPPVPGKVVSEVGQTLFTAEDVRNGQELFLTYGLMQYGSIYGHGAYLGPDFTADYLHRAALEMQEHYGNNAEAVVRTQKELQANRYDQATDVLTWTDGQAKAFDTLREHYEQAVLNRQQSGGGLGSHAVIDPDQSRQIVAFIAWTA
jgi:nitric oxide reductase subunit B